MHASIVICLLGIAVGMHSSAGAPFDEDDYVWNEKNQNCSLSSFSLYSFVVKVWDNKFKTTSVHGSLIAHKAVMTICHWIDRDNASRYSVIGQTFQKTIQGSQTVRKEHCIQTQSVERIIPHPQCGNYFDEYFDYSIMQLAHPFYVQDSYVIPTMPFINAPRELLRNIRYIDAVSKNYCEIPLFQERESKSPKFHNVTSVISLPFVAKCVDWYCENEEPLPHEAAVTQCKAKMMGTMNSTYLCIKPSWTNKQEMQDGMPSAPDFRMGVPLICNNSVYGIVVRLKMRFSVGAMCLAMPLALSNDDLKSVLRVCDPSSSGFVSLEYFTQLARAHYNDTDEADSIVDQLSARGKDQMTYQEFCRAINKILKDTDSPEVNCGSPRTKRKKGGRDIMMAPSVGQRIPAKECNNTNNSPMYISDRNGDADKNSQCSSMSDGESFECYGQLEMDTSNPASEGVNRSGSNTNSLRRNTWLRTSLKRTSNNHENLPNRRWGSFRHTSKRAGGGTNSLTTTGLNRSSSFNSSGRSSACDTGDDVYSDVSLEEDVLDLNHKVQMLQEQMSVLADNQNHSDERYTRARQENATLQARVLMLEEQLREVELRAQEKLQDEERRHRELVARVDREKQLQVENCAIRLQTLELENASVRDEAARCRAQADKLRTEVLRLEEEQARCDAALASLREELEMVREQERQQQQVSLANQQLIEELSHELERLRDEHKRTLQELEERGSGVSSSAHEQLRSSFTQLREENKRLQEAHDELQALLLTKSVEEGRNLLTGHTSLAAELEAMSQSEPTKGGEDVMQVKNALKEQQEVNNQLRSYIDGILLNIVDNYPQLLEVKPPLSQ